MANIIETGIEYSRLNDIKYMRSYLMQLNDDLRYMFNNIDLDNFSDEGKESYLKREDASGSLAQSVDSLQAVFTKISGEIETELTQTSDEIELLVKKGNVTNLINLSQDKIKIQASRLHVYSDNFYLDDDVLKVNGTIIATGGEIAGFSIAKDNAGSQYLKGASGTKLVAGKYEGTKGYFKSFSCTDTFWMYEHTAYMVNCQIQSTGLKLKGIFNSGAMYICHYSESTDQYTNWQPLNVKGALNVSGDIHVGKNGDDSGIVTCLTVVSSTEGERPGDYEDSDIFLKKDTKELDTRKSLDFINGTRPVSFNFKGNAIRQAGVIAQEADMLQKDIGCDYGLIDKSEKYLLVSYTRYVPIMAAALREIDKKIKEVRNGTV